MVKNYTLQQVSEAATMVLKNAKQSVVLFYGEMGAGKTTLIKEIAKQLNVISPISSPTYSIVNEYITKKNQLVYHFDFYRIENEDEALDIGVEEYFYSGNLCFVEWPENVKNLIPLKNSSVFIIQNEDNTRTITIKNNE